MLEDVLSARYPQLLFLLHMQKHRLIISERLQMGNSTWIERVKKQNPALILFVGLVHPVTFLSLEDWLQQHPESTLLVFEEHLEVVQTFLQESEAERLLKHPQIHLRYILEHAELLQALKEAVKEYPAEHVFIELSELYLQRYSVANLSLEVFRRATITSALFNEDVYYHLLCRNLLANFLRMPSCFYADALKSRLQGIPAIVCGAGPSLKHHISLLKQLHTKAVIIAGGSTLAALSSQGVRSHLGLALDPNPEEYERFKANQDFEVPILFGSRVAASIFRTCNGPSGYMRTFSGGFLEQAMEEQLSLTDASLFQGVSQEGLSVTVMCVAAAIRFGCNPIFLSGIDLAYTEGKRYAEGVVQEASVALEELQGKLKTSERLLCRENKRGEKIHTAVKWVMEAAAIEELARLHPSTQVLDCVEGGLGFASLTSLSLHEAARTHLTQEYDIQGYVHQIMQDVPTFKQYAAPLKEFLEVIEASVLRSQTLLTTLLEHLKTHNAEHDPEESSFLTLYGMDLREEMAYQYFLEPLEELITPRLRQEASCSLSEQRYAREVVVLQKKWEHFQKLLEYYLALLATSRI